MNPVTLRGMVQWVGMAGLAFALSACHGDHGPSDPLIIQTLSKPADLVSGGAALVESVLPAGASTSGLKVDVGGRDVSDAFALRANGRVLGVVAGLATGNNVVTAKLS